MQEITRFIFKITFKKYIADVTVFLACYRNMKVTKIEKKEVSAQCFPV